MPTFKWDVQHVEKEQSCVIFISFEFLLERIMHKYIIKSVNLCGAYGNKQ